MADPTSTYTIKIDSNAAEVGRDGADSLQHFADSVTESETRVKEYNSELKRLKGTSDEIKGLKDQLRAKIDAEKNSISQNSAAVLKNGSSITQLRDRTRALAKNKTELKTATAGATKEMSHSGGEASGLASKLATLSEMAEGAGAALEAGVTVAALAGVAAVAALAAVAVTAAVAFAKFAFETRAAERSLNLFRVAATGSTENATHLGQQIDALAKKVRTPREELNKLGNELGKTRLRGQTYVDTFNAIGQASAALGDDVGAKIKELVTRGQYTQRFSLGAFELEGTGLHTDDVAGELAKRMKIGIGDARAALAEGRVTLADGAAALRAAVEKSVAGVNLESLKDPAVAIEKFKDSLKSLVSGVNIEPLLNDLKGLFDLFDSEASVTGAALKTMATALGSGMVDGVHQSSPLIKDFVRYTVLGALQIGVAYYKTKLAIKAALKEIGDKNIQRALTVIKIGAIGVAVAIGAAVAVVAGVIAAVFLPLLVTVGGAVAIVGGTIAAIALAVTAGSVTMMAAFDALKKKLTSINWKDIGAAILDGLVGPLRKGAAAIKEVANGLGNAVKKGVAEPLEIHSPSKVMQRYAEFTVDPFVDGIRAGVPQAARALDDLTAPAAPRGGGGGGTHIEMNVQIDATHEVAKELAVPSVLEQMRRAMADVLRSAGLPVEKH